MNNLQHTSYTLTAIVYKEVYMHISAMSLGERKTVQQFLFQDVSS